MLDISARTALLGLIAILALGATQALQAAPSPDPVPEAGDTLDAARALLKSKNWSSAARELASVVRKEPGNAEAHNLLGYALRNGGDLPRAKTHYDEALRLNPKHLGAHEYIGQLYLRINQPVMARKHLAELEALCGKDCDEYRSLAKAVSAQ